MSAHAPLLLIHPPVAKACEPPAGIARLAAALDGAGVPCRLLDANLEGQLALLAHEPPAADTWSRRAAGQRDRHLAALRTPGTYRAPARYNRAVSDLNRLLDRSGAACGATIGLADYRQEGFSPLSSADLLRAAAHPERNPFYPWFSARLPPLLEGVRIVGLSLNYLSQALCTFAMAGFIRRHAPQAVIVLGGGLTTSWLRRPDWRNPFGGLIDHLAAGPGEAFLLGLCGAAPAGPPPLPGYAALPLADYLAPGLILPYSSAAGCWWNGCSFCPERAEGNVYRPLPAPQAAADLHALCAVYRPHLVHLLDNAVSPALLRALCAAPLPVPWYGFARIDAQLADPDFCRELRRAGCVMLKLGLESGDQEVLDRLNKGIDLATTERALAALRSAGIAVYGYLLFGTPAEDEAAARRTLDFVVRNSRALDFLNVALFNMPVGATEARDYGTAPFYSGDLSLYTDFCHPLGWQRGKVRRFIGSEFSRHPAVAAILRRDPPLFTSNHAPLFVQAAREQGKEGS
ncbi:MAG: radical SAM protein [Deltaproteobacteria bacterium]|nr:MAG: radical SAM protein [Deltaproteobacteria bacterium]